MSLSMLQIRSVIFVTTSADKYYGSSNYAIGAWVYCLRRGRHDCVRVTHRVKPLCSLLPPFQFIRINIILRRRRTFLAYRSCGGRGLGLVQSKSCCTSTQLFRILMHIRRCMDSQLSKIRASGPALTAPFRFAAFAAARDFGGSTRGIPNRAARRLRFSSSSSSAESFVGDDAMFALAVVGGGLAATVCERLKRINASHMSD
jgi:hypothetical protein